MSTEPAKTTNTGVQDLIDRIRDQGVRAAQEKADTIVREAEARAAELLAEARTEAARMREEATKDIEAEKTACLEAVRLSARDAVLQLKSQLSSSFEVFVKRLVTSATLDKNLIKDLVLVLAGHAVDDLIRNKDIQILVSQAILSGTSSEALREHGKNIILALSSDMLREGVELIPSDGIEGGARVRLVRDKLEIDLSDRAIARLLSERMLPRFRRILEGVE
jgi:V/A-type H+-transporting ATPase subunit E